MSKGFVYKGMCREDRGRRSRIKTVSCPGWETSRVLCVIADTLTVDDSCHYRLQLTSTTLECVFITFNCIHLAHFPLICMFVCIIRLEHLFFFYLYVASCFQPCCTINFCLLYVGSLCIAAVTCNFTPWDLFIYPKLFICCMVKCLWRCLFAHLPNQWLCPPPVPPSSTSLSNSFSFIPNYASSPFNWVPLKFQCLTAHLAIYAGVNVIRCRSLYSVISGELELFVLLSQADKNMRDSGAGITESTYKKKVKTWLMVWKCVKLTVLTQRSVHIY